MKLLLRAAVVLLCAMSLPAFASSTTVTASVVDTDGQAWLNGTWNATLTLPSGPFGNQTPTIGGSAVPVRHKGTLDANGVLTAVLTDTSSLDQVGGQWVIQVCPNSSVSANAATGCATVTAKVTGASVDLSARFSGVTAPRFPAGSNAFGYGDVEVLTPTIPGVGYFNTGNVTATQGVRIWDGKQFTGVGAGGGGSLPGGVGLVKSNNGTGAIATAGIDYVSPNVGSRYGGPQEFQIGPRFGTVVYHAYGDSNTFCTGVASIADCYVTKIATKVGVSAINHGVGGYYAHDVVRRALFPTLNPIDSNNALATLLVGENDLHWCGTPSVGGSNVNGNTPNCLSNYYSAMMAALSYSTISITGKVFANQATSTTGTWASDTTILPYGLASGTPGSTATYTFTTTRANQPIYPWFGGIDGSNATGALAIDGGQVDTITSASPNAQCICTIDGYNETVWGKRFVVATAGAHTFTVTVTAASGGSTLRYLGLGVAPVNPLPKMNPPSIFVASPFYELNFTNSDATDAYNATLAGEVTLLQGDGLLIGYADSRPAINNVTAMQGINVTVPNGMGDDNAGTVCSAVTAGNVNVHMNICGHTMEADLFLSRIQPSGGGSNFPSPVSTLDALTSTSTNGQVLAGVNGGLNWSTAGTATPGYAAGVAFMTSSGPIYRIVNYNTTAFYSTEFCTSPAGTAVSSYANFSWCPVLIPTSKSATLGALYLRGDANSQAIVMEGESFDGNKYLVSYQPYASNQSAGLYTHVTSGVTDQIGLFSHIAGGFNADLSVQADGTHILRKAFAQQFSGPVFSTGNSGNTDTAGFLTLGATSTVTPTQTFTQTYPNPLPCIVQPQSISPSVVASMGAYVPTVTTTALYITVATAPSSNVVFAYHCFGNN